VSRPKALTTNDVIDLFVREKSKAKLRVRKQDQRTILIEGPATAFDFLGRFLLAFSKENDCTRHISPSGPGRRWFTKNSKLGFYFHKLPCSRNVVLRKLERHVRA
jgi:hypothetical protein